MHDLSIRSIGSANASQEYDKDWQGQGSLKLKSAGVDISAKSIVGGIRT